METLPGCSLEDMLASRDKRRERQQRHFSTTPDTTLAVATVVAPGEHKLTPGTDVVAEAMCEALRERFGRHIVTMDHVAPVSGHEVWLTLSCPPAEAKRIAVEIEDTHTLGRLFDIDVILPDLHPLGRKDIGMPPRSCMLCENEARFCMRSHRHTYGELQRFIDNLIRRYLHV